MQDTGSVAAYLADLSIDLGGTGGPLEVDFTTREEESVTSSLRGKFTTEGWIHMAIEPSSQDSGISRVYLI